MVERRNCMRYLTPISFAAFMFLCTATLSAQTINPAKIKFKGIGLDSTYAQVVKALGKPENEEIGKEEGCIGGHEKTVKYPGLSIYFMDGDSKDGKTFEIKNFEITGPGYVVDGISVGDSESAVKKRLGRKFRTEAAEPGEKAYFYHMNDIEGPGTTRFVFKGGKLILIASDYLVC